MGVYDLSMKTLFDDSPEDLIAAALGDSVVIQEVRLEPTENLILERRMDRLARVRASGEELLVLPEFKATYSADIDRQMMTYISRAIVVHGFLPVWPVVYYLTDEGFPREPKSAYVSSALGRRLCEVRYFEVRLFEWNAREVLTQKRGALLALVALMREADASVVEQASRAIQELDRPVEVKGNLQAVLGLVSKQALPELDLERLVPKELYMKSTFYEQIVDEGRLIGVEEGRKQGLEQVRQEEAAMVLQLLRLKLGREPVEQDRTQIASAELDALRQLVLELASTATVEQAESTMRAWVAAEGRP